MQLEEILAEWDKDVEINYTELGEEARKIPRLHAKYLRMLTMEKLTLKQLESKFKKFKFTKQQYYLDGPSNMAEFEQKKKEWKTVPEIQRTIPRTLVDGYLEVDEDIDTMKLRLELAQTKIDALDFIMKSIMQRSYLINNMITWQQWNGGGK